MDRKITVEGGGVSIFLLGNFSEMGVTVGGSFLIGKLSEFYMRSKVTRCLSCLIFIVLAVGGL